MKLRTRMTLLLAVPVFIGLAAMTVIIGLLVSDVVNGVVLELTLNTVEARGDEIGRWIDGHRNNLERTAGIADIRSQDPERMRSYILSRNQNLLSDVDFDFGATADGTYFDSMGGGGNIADRDYFMALKNGADFFVTGGLESRSTNSNATVMALALRNEAGQFYGIAAAQVGLDTLSEIISHLNTEDSYAVLFDGAMLPIAHPDSDMILNSGFANPSSLGFKGFEGAVEGMLNNQEGS